MHFPKNSNIENDLHAYSVGIFRSLDSIRRIILRWWRSHEEKLIEYVIRVDSIKYTISHSRLLHNMQTYT